MTLSLKEVEAELASSFGLGKLSIRGRRVRRAAAGRCFQNGRAWGQWGRDFRRQITEKTLTRERGGRVSREILDRCSEGEGQADTQKQWKEGNEGWFLPQVSQEGVHEASSQGREGAQVHRQ